MDNEETFLAGAARTPRFINDLRTFLLLDPSGIRIVAEVGRTREGYTRNADPTRIEESLNVSREASRIYLRVAEFMYDKAIESGLDTNILVDQVALVASSLESPVEINEEAKAALVALLSLNREHEITIATRGVLGDGPQFLGLAGSWNIKPVQLRTGEIVGIRTVTLSLVWENGAEQKQEVFLQMSEEDWDVLKEEVEWITTLRGETDEFLPSVPGRQLPEGAD